MTVKMKSYHTLRPWLEKNSHLAIQAPLPDFLDTLPILLTINGQGSGRQGPPPLASAEKPAND